MTYDSLQDPVNSPDWYEQEIGEQVDHAYDRLVADCVEHFPERAPADPVKHYITWKCETCSKLRSAPCAPSCVFGGQADAATFKLARIESERREAFDGVIDGEPE